jgi:hypothetical protein
MSIMKLHVLPGDATVESFRSTGIDAEIVVCRECLIEGDVQAKSLDEFWEVRANFLADAHPVEKLNYRADVAAEFEKLIDLPSTAEVNLWFEYELFCQTNMWFCLSLLEKTAAEVYRVAPITLRKDEAWNGFGRMTQDDLKKCFSERLKFGDRDIELGVELWRAYQIQDHARLEALSKTGSACFPYLEEVCRAEIEKETRPKEVLFELRRQGITDFGKMFVEFKNRAGVYGYGDLQVKRLLQEIS